MLCKLSVIHLAHVFCFMVFARKQIGSLLVVARCVFLLFRNFPSTIILVLHISVSFFSLHCDYFCSRLPFFKFLILSLFIYGVYCISNVFNTIYNHHS